MILNRNKLQLSVDRVNNLRAEIDDFIDARVVELKASSPGVPSLVLRNILTARSGGCHCIAFLHIAEQDEADADLKAQQKAAKV
jgi:hypothetical protein